MDNPPPRPTARVFHHPFHRVMVPLPMTCFAGALVTDVTFACTADMQWANLSAWLLTLGLAVSAFAIVADLVDLVGERRIGALRGAWIHGFGNTVAVGLSSINILVHSRDGYASVVPFGVMLSGLVTLILAVTGWHGWDTAYRQGVGAPPARK